MKTGQKLVYSVFVIALIYTFIASHAARVAAADLAAGIAASAEDIHPVKTGDMAPGFTVRTVDDEPFVFDPQHLDAPVVLITFRGGWCPYCNMHLSELHTVVPELQQKGIDVYFLSGDRPDQLYTSLKLETQEAIDGLGYKIFSDANIEAARALGIAFRDDKTMNFLEQKGRDIEGSSMRNFGVLPVPAVYIIDKSGKVVFSFVEPNYKIRLPADDLRAAVDKVMD